MQIKLLASKFPIRYRGLAPSVVPTDDEASLLAENAGLTNP
jgi:hypothetical protein